VSSPARRLLLGLFLGALVFSLASGLFVHRSQPRTTTYSDLIATVEHQPSSISEVLFNPRSRTAEATLTDSSKLSVHYPSDQSQAQFQTLLEQKTSGSTPRARARRRGGRS
jgi:hypothetical protein